MDHRLFAVLVIIGFALQGAGCASESQRARREEILMPLQTGSTIQRRVMIDTGVTTKKSTKKKKKEKEKDKEKESKRNSPKPPSPTPEPSPPRPEDESTAPPDRFR